MNQMPNRETNISTCEEDWLIICPLCLPPPSVLFTWWIYDDVTSMILVQWEISQLIKADTQRLDQKARRHMVIMILPHLFPFISFFAPLSQSSSVFLHECLYHRSQSPLKQTSVGSLSNSAAVLHHNRPPAVIEDILSSHHTEGRRGSIQQSCSVPLRHIKPP